MAKILNTSDFINRVTKIHNGKYDYSKVIYTGSKSLITIVCPIHGDFVQKATNHYKSGCPKCSLITRGKKRQITNEMFLHRAIEIHGTKYDYSKSNYTGWDKEVIIGCPVHGDFKQKGGIHLKNCGCNKCANEKLATERKRTTEEFVSKAKKIHGDRFDYSKVNYINNNTKVIIICPIHGEFEQIPFNHLKGMGCAKCSGIGKLNTTEFIERSMKIHGNKYDYSKTKYINNVKPVTITCHIHGDFVQRPSKHLSGHNCPDCTGRIKLTTENFIQRAKQRHGDKFDYSKSNYINYSTPVIIGCRIHGDFIQRPSHHLNGGGCQKCNGGGKKKLTTEEFIERSNKIHYNLYDYSEVIYVNAQTKVKIICPEHGPFYMSPNSHLRGNRCIKCNGHGFPYKSIEEVKSYVHSLRLTSAKAYKNWWDENRIFCLHNGIPKYPEEQYKK